MLRFLEKYGFISLIAICVLFVYVQGTFNIIEEPELKVSLSGIEESKLDLGNWLNGTFQADVNNYAKRNFGFFNSAIKSYNQLDFSVFNKAHAKSVIVGKESYLYERDYIEAYFGRDLLTNAEILNKAQKLKQVQEHLDSLGISIIVILAPGKASFYPEYIPNYLIGPVPAETNRSKYIEAFNEKGIAYLDFMQWFLSQKSNSKYPLVSQTGIHWSYYGMLLATDSIINYSEKLLKCDLPNVEFGKIELTKKPKSTDGDIEVGMNIFSTVNEQELAYPKYSFEIGNFDKKKAILVGDSYGLGLYHRNFLSESFTNGEFWFYNKLKYKKGEARSKLAYDNWLAELMETDVVMLLCTEATLKSFAFGFIDKTHAAFFPKHPENVLLRKRITGFKRIIQADSSSVEYLRSKSLREGISIEKAIELEAEYYYEQSQKK